MTSHSSFGKGPALSNAAFSCQRPGFFVPTIAVCTPAQLSAKRKAVETEIGERKPRYGETLTLSIDGNLVRAKITAVWRPPSPQSEICMIHADEIGEIG